MAKLTDDLTARLRQSRFGKDVFGPKIAQPTARWIQAHFPESDRPGRGRSDSERTGPTGDHDSSPADSVEALGAPTAPAQVDAEAIQEAERQAAVAQTVETVLSTPSSAEASSTRLARAATPGPSPHAAADVPGSVVAPPSMASFAGIAALLKHVGEKVKSHDLVVVGAGIAFWGLLAIPATLFALVSIAGLVLDPETVRDQVERNLSGLPEDAKSIISGQLEGVSGGSTGGLIAGLVVGLALAFWTASGAIAKLMGALNTIYETNETRNFAKLRGTAVLLTLGGIVFISSAIFLLAALPPIVANIDGIGPSASVFFTVLRFPVLGLVMVLALGILYHLGPDRDTKYRPVTVGATVAMLLWLVLSALFTVYTSTVATYNETYGSIGGIVILLLWLFITSFVVLIGAEIHAYREVVIRRQD